MDEFSDGYEVPEAPPPPPPPTWAEAMATVPVIRDWLESPALACRLCGQGFRDPYDHQAVAGEVRKDVCYDCVEAELRRSTNERELRSVLSKLIPPEFEGKTLDVKSFKLEPDLDALDLVSRWKFAPRNGRSLYLWSKQPGTGKSHMAYAIARREILEGRRIVALEWTELLAKFRSTYGKKLGATSEEELDRMIERCDLLLVDDVAGDGKVNDWALGKLWELVNTRYIHQRQLLLTTQFPMVSFDEWNLTRILGASGRRVVSRLQAMVDEIQVRGQDARGQLSLLTPVDNATQGVKP